ncbi:PREDICTED: GTP cyclohydrolase 1-like [Tarenaya hassleriana]|uniref:GTP cyclohydrolase 1-like n=1 Tax=Tarenaya hassleriana TaxID=28532 RepID=UPI00053C5896|nr:PREDICTED: GTP cyclohydrolase 1-like [Tarenaya hassleriana]
MGALDEGHFNLELENDGKNGSMEVAFEHQPETLSIQEAVRVLLQGLGEDINREGIKKTPFRVAKALREGTRGYKLKVKDFVQSALFPEAGLDEGVGQAGGVGGLVVVRDLDHYSYCESCLLPFQVRCHVGYVPSGQRVLGLSKFSRVADVFAKRLQDPQHLADDICSALQQWVKPSGVAVVLQCSHIHFPSLEMNFLASSHHGFVKLLVSSGSGAFEDERSDLWGEFLSLLRFKGVKTHNLCRNGSVKEWCPSVKSSSKFSPADPEMVSAVNSILKSLGEDPSRKELVGTPTRFLKWMMNFQNANLEMKLGGFGYDKTDTKSNGEIEETLHCERNLPFWSMCEHHLLPFYGVVHIGYFCSDGYNPMGKSLVQSVVHFFGFKLQVQERMTRQIAETLSPLVGGDIIVVAEAGHTCMISRGIEKFGSSTATIAVLGRFSTDISARTKFLDSIQNSS